MASNVLPELLARNRKYATTHKSPPALMEMAKVIRSTGIGTIVISCSDPRINPYQIFGIDPTIKGLTMVRNAGGRALDALRTVSALQAVANPRTIVILHHTDCGMSHISDADVKKSLLEHSPQDKDVINTTRYGEITGSIDESVKEDVAILKNSPFVLPGTRVVGMTYDLKTGLVSIVEEAEAGVVKSNA